MPSEITVVDLIQWLLGPDVTEESECLTWPPDSFGAASFVLQRSGWYKRIIENWPPQPHNNHDEWILEASSVGAEWRESGPKRILPERVKAHWQTVFAHGSVPVSSITPTPILVDALLSILVFADQASKVVGLGLVEDDFDAEARQLLIDSTEGANLCKYIDNRKIRVLPKIHTSQFGLTIRSLSHFICLCLPMEVTPQWIFNPSFSKKHSLNLLVLPFPLKVEPRQFKGVKTPAAPRSGYGYFEFEPTEEDLSKTIMQCVADAEAKMGTIDGVVLPELALTKNQLDAVRPLLLAKNVFIICGTFVPSADAGSPSKNIVTFSFPSQDEEANEETGEKVGGGEEDNVEGFNYNQNKHHRWQLDRDQILSYGIGSCLDPSVRWWEYIPLEKRELFLVTLEEWLTVCVLICEDLARQDPIAEVVRSIGPNLVVALLMDGPQLAGRWPGRYALVLADDPGSSVLSLSSAGMVALSSPPPGVPRSDSVALWKDAAGGSPRAIQLKANSKGIVLTLTRQTTEEFTADGRSDLPSTHHVILSGIHHV